MFKNLVLNRFYISSFCMSIMAALLMTSSVTVQASTVYVSDELKVPMRSGATNGHRIVKFLKSGTSMTVLGGSDDEKFVEVQIADGKSGWVSKNDIMNVRSGRDRLVSVNKALSKSKKTIKDLKAEISTLTRKSKKLSGEKNSLQSERTNLTNSLDDLKITAANPLALSKKNKQLKKELGKVKDNASMLEKDNQQLRSNVAQEWFIIGGAVAMGSLILGLLLTRINWRRKKDNWGDSF